MFALATTVGDREGALAAKLQILLPRVIERFDVVAVQGTTVTHDAVVDALDDAGATLAREPPDVNQIGAHRRKALALAMSVSPAERVVYMDIDHALRWIENDPAELDDVLAASREWDCTVIGRAAASFDRLPERLATTERIVNHIYELMSGRRWDLMMAARSLSRAAAGSIVDRCAVDTIGNDVAWPLHCEAHGFTVGYLEAEGLTYRTNIDYAEDLDDSRDGDPRAWASRVLLAAQHVEAMLPFINEVRR
jgi:hypothetical protein